MTRLKPLLTVGAVSAVLLCLAPTSSLAHREHFEAEIKALAYAWAAARQGDETSLLEPLLAENFNGSAQARFAYLRRAKQQPMARIDLTGMRIQVSEGKATIAPVIVYPYREMRIPVAQHLEARLQDGEWRLQAIVPAKLPQALQRTDHPLAMRLQDVEFEIEDTDGNGLHARVHIVNERGRYFAPNGHRESISVGWREDVGGDVVIDGKTFAYVPPRFAARLPAGEYRIEIWHGPEFEPLEGAFSVSEEPGETNVFRLERWVHMAALGWYSGDSHTHFLDPDTAALEARAEDLNVVNVLASSGGNLITSVAHFTGKPAAVSDERHIVFIGEETRHDYLGHGVLLGLRELIYPMGWGVPFTGVPGAYDYPTMARQLARARAVGATTVWAHFPHPHAELPIDTALGVVDAVETMVFGNPFHPHPARYREEGLNTVEFAPLDLWYTLLNAGFEIPGLGATDKMWNSQLVGGVRTYVLLPDGLSYDAWLEGLRRGRSQISSGPVVFLDLDGHMPGDRLQVETATTLPFSVRVLSRLPMDRVELVVNGAVVDRESVNSRRSIDWKGEVTIGASAWIAARVVSDHERPIQSELTGEGSPAFAHTNPIYVQVAGEALRQPEAVETLRAICAETLRWATERGHYPSPVERDDALATYREGCAVYDAD